MSVEVRPDLGRGGRGEAADADDVNGRPRLRCWIGMGAVILVLVGLGAIAAAVSTGSVTAPQNGRGFGDDDPLSTVMTGADFAVLIAGILGALAGAREYDSRMIAATIAAVPRRWQVVVAKAVVLTGVVLPSGRHPLPRPAHGRPR
jgi:ABC-2 type transport system permease protein